MEFGSEEWFEKVDELYEFPIVFAFYVSSDRKINSIAFEDMDQDEIDELRYELIEPVKLHNGHSTALTSLQRCMTSQDYYEECKRLKEIWSS